MYLSDPCCESEVRPEAVCKSDSLSRKHLNLRATGMIDWLSNLIDWHLVLRHLRDLFLAYLFAIPIAWNREAHARSAGLRTFPLVAVAACGYMLIGYQVLDSTDAEARGRSQMSKVRLAPRLKVCFGGRNRASTASANSASPGTRALGRRLPDRSKQTTVR